MKLPILMRKINRFLLLLFLMALPLFASGQDSLRLRELEFLTIVKNYHPLAFRYRLQNKIAVQEVQKAKGNFDPLLEAKNGSKSIDGNDYYLERGVKVGIPSWYGIDLNASYNYLQGQRLNTGDTKGGLFQMGVTLPLAKNLLYDKRRALLDQAKFAQQMTRSEQLMMTNQLLLDAENCYWEWVKQYELFALQQRAVNFNKSRLILIRRTLAYGERSAIDTTEALSQLLSFELQMEEAYLKLVKSTQQLSFYLWTDNNQPYDLSLRIRPSENLTNASAYQQFPTLLMELDARGINQHAALQYYQQKSRSLESERKLKQQSLLPKLDFSYNFLNKANYPTELFPFFQDNYQFGLKLELPLFWREARADYQNAKSKLAQNNTDTEAKRQEIAIKIANYKAETLNYNKQIVIAQKNIDNYRRLLAAEEMRFENGESSLFLINSRETKLLESELKLLELRFKFLYAYNQLKWLNENFETIS